MKIIEINTIPKEYYLKEKFNFATCSLEKLPYALVQIKTDENITGYGECPAYWDPSGETQQSAIGAINLIKESLLGYSPFQIEKIMKICDEKIYGAFSAKCGIDMALYDIMGKKLKIPVYELLGGNNYEVKVNGVISISNTKETINALDKIVSEGYEYIKIKIGNNPQKDEETLSAIREKYPSIKLFVDVNQGWHFSKNALSKIDSLQKYNLAWIEQPTSANDLEGLKKVTTESKMPIMADESLYSYQNALNMAKNRTADMFNIKLSKAGGMFYAARIKAVADAANIPCMLGSMIESSLGMLANYHFAKANHMITCGLSAFKLISNDYNFNLEIIQGKLILETELPGLGYPDESVLSYEFEVKKC